MSDKDNKASVNINITRSNVVLQPNAEKGEMIFYGDQFAPPEYRQQQATSPTEETVRQPQQPPTIEDTKREKAIDMLKRRVDDETKLDDYLRQIGNCETASELAEVIVYMCHEEEWLDEVEIVKERFIDEMRVLAPKFIHGNSLSNIRARIKERK